MTGKGDDDEGFGAGRPMRPLPPVPSLNIPRPKPPVPRPAAAPLELATDAPNMTSRAGASAAAPHPGGAVPGGAAREPGGAAREPGGAAREPGERLGRYHIVGKIAQGGMAEVLLAKLVGPQGFERPVIIKRILPQLVGDKKFIDMFVDEAKLIAGIRHPNVVQVQELSEAGEYFLVMEYLAGETLSSVMRRLASKGKRLPYAVCAYIVAEAAAGLHAAHELRDPSGARRNVVHRDVSPQNIFVCYDGVVKVIDFGIAKATDRMTKTEAGQLKGKFAYMSPESCRGGTIDRRTDLFALATVLYEISTCMRLFVRSTDMKTLEAVCYEPIRAPSELVKDYPPELEAVVMKGLERDPARRYQSGADLRRDLVHVAHMLGEGSGLPEEQLSAALRSLFTDRIAEKDEMVRRVRAGAVLENLPEGEVDENVELPQMAEAEAQPQTAASITGVRMEPPPGAYLSSRHWLSQQEKWKYGLLLGVVGGIALVAALSFLATKLLRRAPDAEPAVPAVEAPTEARPSRVTEQAERGEVTIALDTTPSGANVLVEGVHRGITPLTLTVPRSNAPMAVELEMPGYVRIMEAITPDASQRLGFSLEQESKKRR